MTSTSTSFEPLLIKWWSLIALVASLAMLAAAWSFQLFGHLMPCHLCLHEREVYWLAATVAAVATIWIVIKRLPHPPRWVLFLIAAIFAGSCVLAAYHAGVEWHWWRGPEGCTAQAGGVSAAQMAAFLGGAKTQSGPMCDQAAWTMFGLSMAGYNALISLGLTLVSLGVAVRAK
jgi:disulfide bond formation protein DsbB